MGLRVERSVVAVVVALRLPPATASRARMTPDGPHRAGAPGQAFTLASTRLWVMT